MTNRDHYLLGLHTSETMFKASFADFSDTELYVRPLPNANHPAWQIGHIICSEYRMLTAQGFKMPELPPGFTERFTADTAKLDAPEKFATKAEFLEIFAQVRAATLAIVQTATEEELSRPNKIERLLQIAPTVGSLFALIPLHYALHTGQIQVDRRKLGKPILR